MTKKRNFLKKQSVFPRKLKKKLKKKKKPKNWGFALIPYQIKEEFLYFH